MKKIILLFAIASILVVGCKKKEETPTSVNLDGSKWQSYSFTASDNVTKYYDVLVFKSGAKVDHSVKYPTPNGGNTG